MASIGLLAVMVVLGVPPILRLLVALPAGLAASGYIQARMRFCAGFATAGVYNFGDVGPRERVTDTAALAADRRTGFRIYLASAVVGLVTGIVAVLLPI